MEFVVDKANVRHGKLITSEPLVVRDGELLLAVTKFSFTSNNVSYAKLGSIPGMEYWKFYPCEDGSKGKIPVWGLARVVASRHPDIDEGEMVYGFFPMAKFVVLKVNKLDPVMGTFYVDRPGLAPIYSTYNLASKDMFYSEDNADFMLLFRPLFFTGWLIEDFFRTNNYFDAKEILISSASSKTALSVALMLRRGGFTGTITGLTGNKNMTFVKRLGLYDKVVEYEQMDEKLKNSSYSGAYIDMAGNVEVTAKVHRSFRDLLGHSCIVGNSHWEVGGFGAGPKNLPGPRPKMFFAPTYKVKGGIQEMMRRMPGDWFAIMASAAEWMKICFCNERNVEDGYMRTVNGRVKPNEGLIMSLWPRSSKL